MKRPWLNAFTLVSLLAAIGLTILGCRGLCIDFRRITGDEPRWYLWYGHSNFDSSYIRLGFGNALKYEWVMKSGWLPLIGCAMVLPLIRLIKPLGQMSFRSNRTAKQNGRFRRWSYSVLVLSSFAIFSVICIGRIISEAVPIGYSTENPGGGFEFGTIHGMYLLFAGGRPGSKFGWFIPNCGIHMQTIDWNRFDPANSDWRAFQLDISPTDASKPFKQLDVFLPTWPLLIVSGALPFWYVLRLEYMRKQRRIAAGCCADCGYILLGSSGRCPECGLAYAGLGST